MACRALQQPRVATMLPMGGTRDEWEQVFDLANVHRDDDAVLRALEAQSSARRDVPLMRRGGRLRNARSLAAQFRGAFNRDIGGVSGASDSWHDASFVALDGVSGKVQSLVDYIDASHLFTQASVGAQCAVAADALFANAPTLTFVRSASTRYDSNRGAALWPHLHNGTGCEWFVSMAPTFTGPVADVYLSTATTATLVGMDAYVSSATGHITRVWPITPSPVVASLASAGWTNGAATYVNVSHGSAESPDVTVRRRGSSVATANYTNPPSASNPQSTLTLGAQLGGANGFQGKIRALYTFRRVLSSAHRVIVQQWIQRDTGVPA